jgi:3-oxoacyl-[acyl-carrier protein] reductase
MNLENKTIVITGGGQGLGRAMAIHFAKNGANIALIDLNEDLLRETVELVEQNGTSYTRAKYYLANVSNEAQVESTFKQIREDFNGIDGLIKQKMV